MTIILFLLGAVFGAVAATCVFSRAGIGTLQIAFSDLDGPYLFLELAKNVESFAVKKYVVLKVRINDCPPRR